tara:strand:- start:3637 stop:3876 length:240 start_codon:yes stop_codon:yes gene_type:complete
MQTDLFDQGAASMPGSRQTDLEQLIAENLQEAIEDCQEQESYLRIRALNTGLAIYEIRANEAKQMRITAEKQLADIINK